MRKLSALIAFLLLLAACVEDQTADAPQTSAAGTTTSTEAPTTSAAPTSTTAPPEVVVTTCEQADESFSIICEAVDLVREHYVDEIPDLTLAVAADRGVEEFASPGSRQGSFSCPVPSDDFVMVCEEIDQMDLAPASGAEAAVRGITRFALDPNSAYFDPAALALLQEEQSGSVQGIGALVNSRDLAAADPETTQCQIISETCVLVIVATLEDSPAEEAGLEDGDVFSSVDGEDITGWTIDEVTSRVRGPAGTDVTIGVLRDGEMVEITITRAEIEIPVVETDLVDDVGYIRLNVFTDNADELVREAIAEALDDGADAVVLDLRNNPGGALTAAVGITSEFLGDGVVLRTEAPDDVITYAVEEGGLLADGRIPVVVIVNEGSASASEVVAAALQEADRAVVVGTRTFGKNTVQQRFPLSNGGALKLTVARWVTAGGSDFGEAGVVPDVEAEFDNDMPTELVVERALRLAGTA